MYMFLDDMFTIRPYGEESLGIFQDDINQIHATIKFTSQWSEESVTFPDTKEI